MTIKQLTAKLADVTEALEHLACGDSGLMDNGTTSDDVIAMLDEVYSLVNFCEDELGTRLTRAGDGLIKDTVEGWFNSADKTNG
jgi:hypothetical protein